jgi:hypothetical protein
MYQDESAEHFADGERTLAAIDDAGVPHTGLMQTQKVRILGYEHASRLSCKRQLASIRSSGQLFPSRSRDVNASSPQAGRNTHRDMLIQMKTDAHRQEASSNRLRFNLSVSAEGLLRRNSSACARSARISS